MKLADAAGQRYGRRGPRCDSYQFRALNSFTKNSHIVPAKIPYPDNAES